jgi:hypothetical protein
MEVNACLDSELLGNVSILLFNVSNVLGAPQLHTKR